MYCNDPNILIRLLVFFYAKSEILCIFYTFGIPYLELATFQVLSGYTWLVATILDSIALKHLGHDHSNSQDPHPGWNFRFLIVSEGTLCSRLPYSLQALRMYWYVANNNIILSNFVTYIFTKTLLNLFFF